jgi:hypothetical protein
VIWEGLWHPGAAVFLPCLLCNPDDLPRSHISAAPRRFLQPLLWDVQTSDCAIVVLRSPLPYLCILPLLSALHQLVQEFFFSNVCCSSLIIVRKSQVIVTDVESLSLHDLIYKPQRISDTVIVLSYNCLCICDTGVRSSIL